MALPSVNPEAAPGTGRARGWRRALAPLLWAGGALLLSRSDAALGWAPALGTLRGPLGAVLALLALVLGAASAAPRFRAPRLGARTLFAVAWAFLLVIGLAYTSRLRVTGDEPHYLLMAQSLWREHDLDLRDNLAREDWREYTPGPLAPHYGSPRADGRPFPAHSPGLPFLLAPLYATGGRSLCVALLALFAALLGVEMWRAARERGGGEEGALLAWSLVLLPPVSFYAFHVYTEVPAALAVAVALRLIAAEAAGREPDSRRGMAAALLASALPWLHLKMIGAAVALGVGAMVLLRGRARLAF